MIWYTIRYTIFTIFAILTIYFVWRKKYEHLLWLYFFTFPFQNCAIYAITSWNPYKVVALGMTFVIVFHRIKQNLPSEIKSLTYCFSFLLLAGNIVALCMPAPMAGVRGVIRLFVQDITYILGFVPILYMRYLPQDFGERILKYYIMAICTLIGIGFIHYAFLKAGIPFAPIIRDVGMSNGVAATYFGNSIVYRIYGFCGEPKNMAFALVPFVLLLLAKILIGKEYFKYNFLLLICALFILINTYSSAAYIEFTIGIVVLIYIFIELSAKRVKPLIVSSLLLCCIIVYACILVVPNIGMNTVEPHESQTSFIESFYERSFGRAQNEMEEGRMETKIFKDYIQSNNAIYYLLGYGPGQYSFHTQKLTFANGYIPIQSGLVLNLVDFGICGYVYFIYLLFFILKIYLRNKFNIDRKSLYFIIMGGSVLIGNMMYSMMGGSILIGMLPFIGIAYWIDYYKNKI